MKEVLKIMYTLQLNFNKSFLYKISILLSSVFMLSIHHRSLDPQLTCQQQTLEDILLFEG